MKTIGLIGGMSWESSAEYYHIINETVKARLGALHSAKSIMYTVDFAEIEYRMNEGLWKEITDIIIDAARRVEKGGADFFLICTNTMHKMADEVQESIHIPLLHIVDATAAEIKRKGLQKIGLLGTRYVMEEDFYRGRFENKHGLEVLIPDAAQRSVVHRVIFEELVVGKIDSKSRSQYCEIIDSLVKQGCQGIILGCTEIGLLVKEGDCRVPLFDTTRIHAQAAVDMALAG